jgi:hypothetical protein
MALERKGARLAFCSSSRRTADSHRPPRHFVQAVSSLAGDESGAVQERMAVTKRHG